MDNNLVLEQYLSPASPLLAGFRLDVFSAMKPRVTHSPLSDVDSPPFSSIFDDRYINPAVLYLQVSVLQVFTVTLLYCFCQISMTCNIHGFFSLLRHFLIWCPIPE